MKRIIALAAGTLLMGSIMAQSSLFESVEIQRAYQDGTRSKDGKPGPAYWQNTSKYDLKAELNPVNRMLRGSGTIAYFNNSPDSLRYMVLKLLPNISKKGSFRDYGMSEEQLTDGMVIDSIVINGVAADINNPRKIREYGTNMYVIFGRAGAIAPGARTDLYVEWHYSVPMHGIRNGAYTDSAYFIGYWYPQVAVYDDVYGWDRESYTGKQETYNDLADYEVEINVPGDYVVWATGDQLNEENIFSDNILNMIGQSRLTESTVHILDSAPYKHQNVFRTKRDISWKFTATGVPDFAWACSNYYNWDANMLATGDRKIWINAVYPPGTESFDKVADVAHSSIRYLSEVFPGIPFPFDKHITFNGIHHVAVEYPMMANNSDYASEEMYTEITVHEIAHNYIPFYMLSNERKHAWIDEGWVKLIGEKYGESLGVKREDKEALNTIQFYESIAGTSNDLPLIVPSGNMCIEYNFQLSYAKSANANFFLLELMQDKGVDNPLKAFMLAWEGKHPTPYDFFNFMNTLCGEDLSWYWNKWFFTFNAPDLAIEKGKKDGQVIVSNPGGIPLPVMLMVEYADGSTKEIEKSIWSWSNNNERIEIDIPDATNALWVRLGAAHIPDIDDSNDALTLSQEAD